MSPQNTTPNWHSYIDTGNSADIVKSTTVAQAIGNKIDAINGQATELALDTSSTLDGMTVEEVLARLRTLHDTLASLNDSAPLSGTAGLVSEDHPGIGLHTRGSDNAVLYGDATNGWRPLALTSDLQSESQRAQQAEGNLVSGTKGLDAYSRQIVSIKSQYADSNNQKPIGIGYLDTSGFYQTVITKDGADQRYASREDLQQEIQRAQQAESQSVSGSYTIQRFSASISDGGWVGLPWSFADDDVTFIVQPFVSKTYINIVSIDYDAPTPRNRNGFTAKVFSSNGSIVGWSPFSLIYDVIAIGKTS
ncbi:hypothetical protein [Saccharibacter floricola]|uniref:Tail fiber protein n=1 Tax=Saccharibacter floricola DSM 15669 TaxID=1123227 RepID=A0ABQ0P1A9_9PROT|nr:hypothetical protein [Saccharibacter floricola]GBQ08744.1 hypothetical protein AA15669_1889 [Saccharibacter floricola DSM 15669]